MAVGSTMAMRNVPPAFPTRVSVGVSASFGMSPLPSPPPPPPPVPPPPPPPELLPQAATAITLTIAAAIAGFFPRSIVILPIARTWVVTRGPVGEGLHQPSQVRHS